MRINDETRAVLHHILEDFGWTDEDAARWRRFKGPEAEVALAVELSKTIKEGFDDAGLSIVAGALVESALRRVNYRRVARKLLSVKPAAASE